MSTSDSPEQAGDNSLRNFLLALVAVSVIVIIAMAVIEQTAG